ncbi:MAG: hypothetical protein ACK5HY_00480, partial [Parahaliea sp.]
MNIEVVVVSLLALAVGLFFLIFFFGKPRDKRAAYNRRKGRGKKRISDGYMVAPANLDELPQGKKEASPPEQDSPAFRLSQLRLLTIEHLSKIHRAKVAGMTNSMVKP